MHPSPDLQWHSIDTVLLDMDGTLLDLAFDNWFWLELIPREYAAARGLDVEAARQLLVPKFTRVTGTLPWYCIDHWTRELDLDIRSLTRASLEQVNFLPGADAFLKRLRKSGKRVVLVTNAHPETLNIKNEKVALKEHFDACYSTHPFAAPKENAQFWPRLLVAEQFSPERTLFVDDSLPVLKCAAAFGIAHLRAIRCPDSKQPPKLTTPFISVDRVAELL
jgi:putative hydrolase of the HAD superfamily